MNTSYDPRFPWIEFPANAKVGDLWRSRSEVMPTTATWQYRGGGWECIEDA